MEKLIEVPNIITGKDLDYLADMFEWNIASLKKINAYIPKVNNEEIKLTLQDACKLFENNLKEILYLLEGGTHDEAN